MKIFFLVNVTFIALIVLSRANLVIGGGFFDFILFFIPAAALCFYIYAVLSGNRNFGKIGAFFLILSAAIFCLYGLIDPLGGWVYSFIYCLFIVLVFFPAIFISYNCHRRYMTRGSG